jgi:hypothetical protein
MPLLEGRRGAADVKCKRYSASRFEAACLSNRAYGRQVNVGSTFFTKRRVRFTEAHDAWPVCDCVAYGMRLASTVPPSTMTDP